MTHRVMFVSHDSGVGGAEMSLASLLASTEAGKITPLVVTPCRGELTQQLDLMGIPYLIRPVGTWIPYAINHGIKDFYKLIRHLKRDLWALATIIRDNNIDAVYTNTVTPIFGAMAARMSKLPHIWHIRENIIENRDLKPYLPVNLCKSTVDRLSSHVIFNSRYLRSQFFPHSADTQTSVIYNGIDTEIFDASPGGSASIKEELSLPERTKLVAFVGALSHRKGVDRFLEIAAEISRSIENSAFLLIGDGDQEYKNQMKGLSKSLNIDSSTFFLGKRTDVPALLKQIELLLLTSTQEPFGRVIIEAMAAGKPVVATKSGGPSEIIVHGQTGYLADIGDIQAMSQYAVRILTDTGLSERLGAEGEKRCKQEFSSTACNTNIQSVILDEIQRSKAQSQP